MVVFDDCTNAPVHGEYGVYKTADVSGISTSSEGYRWWYRENTRDNMNLYDRTYGLTTGKQAGYFLYVDASDESREIASDEFTANLCSGTTFIVSAAIADLTLSGQLLHRLCSSFMVTMATEWQGRKLNPFFCQLRHEDGGE